MVVDVRGTTFHMDKTLIGRWDSLKDGKLAEFDEDRVYIVDGEEGCLTGDTLIQISRAKLSRRYTLKKLYNHYNNNPDGILQKGKIFKKNIPSFVRSFNGKDIRLHKLKNVFYSGKKKVYLLELDNGKNIRATSNHKFLTKKGWKQLGSLKNNEEIMCDTLKSEKNNRIKIKLYDIQLKVYHHPYRSPNNRVEVHRLIYEARLNNLHFTEYLDILLNEEDKSKKLKYINPKKYCIHHKDGCHYNNSIDNLQLLKKEEHLLIHSNNQYNNFSQGVPIFSKIKKITEKGIEDTYDIECEEPHHNFVANGIVVHNSGKSLFTIQQASYIDNTLLDDEGGKEIPRICFSSKSFLSAIRNTRSTKEKTKVVVFDEAFRGLSSKSALSKNNKMLVQSLMEARQNNLVVFIVSPSFYLIEFYAAVLRSKALFHVVKEKASRRRYVRVFGKKNKATLYQIGVRKGWGYPIKTKTRVRFFNIYPGGKYFEAKYRRKKRESIMEDEKDDKPLHKFQLQRNAAFKILHKSGMGYQIMEEELAKHKVLISFSQLGRVCRGETDKIGGDDGHIPPEDEDSTPEDEDSTPEDENMPSEEEN